MSSNESITPPPGMGTWWLALLSVSSWGVLALVLLLPKHNRYGEDNGIGLMAFMILLWFALDLMNVVIFFLAIIRLNRPRQWSGRLGAVVAMVHAAFFIVMGLLPFLRHG